VGFAKIGIVSSVPAAGVKPGTGAAVDSLRVVLGNVLEITGKNAAGACTLTLLRWFPPPQSPVPDGFPGTNIDPTGEWRRWREDATISVGAMTDFSGRYEFGHDSAEYWLLLESHSGDAPSLTADAQGVYYRRTR